MFVDAVVFAGVLAVVATIAIFVGFGVFAYRDAHKRDKKT